MKVLIIGATGYVGTAVDEALVARGHQTLGTARSEAAHRRLAARGTAGVAADAAKPSTLGPAVRSADAVVYAVAITDDDPWTVETRALRAIGKSLAGTEKTFVYVSGAWVYGTTGSAPATEDSPLDPPRSMMRRAELERESLAMTRIGVRALNVRPGIAYGRGAGIPAMFVQSARERVRRPSSVTEITAGQRSPSPISASSSHSRSNAVAPDGRTTPSTTISTRCARSPKPRAAAPAQTVPFRSCPPS